MNLLFPTFDILLPTLNFNRRTIWSFPKIGFYLAFLARCF